MCERVNLTISAGRSKQADGCCAAQWKELNDVSSSRVHTFSSMPDLTSRSQSWVYIFS